MPNSKHGISKGANAVGIRGLSVRNERFCFSTIRGKRQAGGRNWGARVLVTSARRSPRAVVLRH